LKRTDLLRQAQSIAKANSTTLDLLREGSGHSIFTINGRRVVVPRHREINEHTARGILNAVRKACQ